MAANHPNSDGGGDLAQEAVIPPDNASPQGTGSTSISSVAPNGSSEPGFNNIEKKHDAENGPDAVVSKERVEEQDPDIVDWDGPKDPANPQNWPDRKKWLHLSVVSAMTLLVPLASSMFAPGVPQVLEEFGTSNQSLATFVVSVFILGFAAGPLVLAPLSELYGRLIPYHFGNIGSIVFTVACAVSTNMNMLIGFRFLAGLVGAVPLTNGAGTIADTMAPVKRGRAIAVWSLGILIGPVIGPIAGGFLAQAEGWAWIFWVIAIATGVLTIASLIILRETHAPTLLERKAKRLRKETGNMNLRSKLDSGVPPREHFMRSIVRPCKLLFLNPICSLLSLYYAFIYAILYLMFTTYTFVFEETYGFDQGTIGLVYVGIGIGLLLGLGVFNATSDRITKSLAARLNNGTLKAEYRLPIVMFAGPFIPIGLFIYGWTAEYRVQWAVPLLGTLLVGFGITIIFTSINTYLIDAFTIYAASAMAANTVLRSIFGAVFPLFGLQMYNVLGLGWGNSLLAFVALAMWPIPLFFWYYGEKLRTHPKFHLKL